MRRIGEQVQFYQRYINWKDTRQDGWKRVWKKLQKVLKQGGQEGKPGDREEDSTK